MMDQLTLNSGCDKEEGLVIGKITVFLEKVIGLGRYDTVVYEGTYEQLRPVAVKRIAKTCLDVYKEGITNYYVVTEEEHPNIVRMYGSESDDDFTYVAMQRCAYNLYDMVQDNKEPVLFLMENQYPSSELLEFMRGIVDGLALLHSLGIIHRDLTPHNVLIFVSNFRGLRPQLSGLCSNTGLPSGTSGCRAPEQILDFPHTQAMDLFSLGCVLFFCLTQGEHPFGDHFERDINVTNNNIVNLSRVEHIYEAIDLIPQLLNSKPELRPKASEVLYHPLFWNSEMRMLFMKDAGDRVRSNDGTTGYNNAALESECREAFCGRWDREMDGELVSVIKRNDSYEHEKVKDLLCFIRNILDRYNGLPMKAKALLGPMPQGVDYYVRLRFPKLLMMVYKVMHRYCKQEEWFCRYNLE